jgi:hypothetical protein
MDALLIDGPLLDTVYYGDYQYTKLLEIDFDEFILSRPKGIEVKDKIIHYYHNTRKVLYSERTHTNLKVFAYQGTMIRYWSEEFEKLYRDYFKLTKEKKSKNKKTQPKMNMNMKTIGAQLKGGPQDGAFLKLQCQKLPYTLQHTDGTNYSIALYRLRWSGPPPLTLQGTYIYDYAGTITHESPNDYKENPEVIWERFLGKDDKGYFLIEDDDDDDDDEDEDEAQEFEGSPDDPV